MAGADYRFFNGTNPLTPFQASNVFATDDFSIYDADLKFDIVVEVFKEDKPASIHDKTFNAHKLENLEFPAILYRISKNSFSNLSLCYAKIFYWAGYFGDE